MNTIDYIEAFENICYTVPTELTEVVLHDSYEFSLQNKIYVGDLAAINTLPGSLIGIAMPEEQKRLKRARIYVDWKEIDAILELEALVKYPRARPEDQVVKEYIRKEKDKYFPNRVVDFEKLKTLEAYDIYNAVSRNLGLLWVPR